LSRRFLLTAFAVSGACGLIYELVWMRRLSLVFGSTTLAVSTVLASFMGGLALGSLLLGRYADRRPERALRTYGFLEFGIGVSALCIPGLLRIVERLYLLAYPSFEGQPQLFSLLQFFLASAVLIVPTAFMGGTLPLLVRYSVSRQGEIGKSVGAFYAANTIGAASGVLLSTYVLLPY
jgi:spermidine synthase